MRSWGMIHGSPDGFSDFLWDPYEKTVKVILFS